MTKKQSPLVTCGELHCADYSFPIEIGSGIWLDWLEKNKSFRFEMELVREFEASLTQKYETTETASFSACKERRPSGEFWYATRKINGKLRRAYLGEGQRLTIAKLEEVARQLHGNPEQSPSIESPPSKPETEELHTCVTNELEVLLAQNEKLKAEVARLEGELRAAAEDFQEQDKKVAALVEQVQHAQSEIIRLEASRVEAIAKNDWLRLEAEIALGKLAGLESAIAHYADSVKADQTVTRKGKDKGAVIRAVDEMTKRLACVTSEPTCV